MLRAITVIAMLAASRNGPRGSGDSAMISFQPSGDPSWPLAEALEEVGAGDCWRAPADANHAIGEISVKLANHQSGNVPALP
jgi:hypothetical protein